MSVHRQHFSDDYGKSEIIKVNQQVIEVDNRLLFHHLFVIILPKQIVNRCTLQRKRHLKLIEAVIDDIGQLLWNVPKCLFYKNTRCISKCHDIIHEISTTDQRQSVYNYCYRSRIKNYFKLLGNICACRLWFLSLLMAKLFDVLFGCYLLLVLMICMISFRLDLFWSSFSKRIQSINCINPPRRFAFGD